MENNHSILSEKQLSLLSVTEASRILKLRKTALTDLISRGLIISIKVGERVKIPYYSLENFIKNLTAIPEPVSSNGSRNVSSAILEKLISKN